MAFNTPMRLPMMRQPRLPMRRLPRGVKALGVQVAAGVAAAVSGSLAAIPFVKDFDKSTTSVKIGTIIAITAAVVGGVLTLVRFAIGPAIAAGGASVFAGGGLTLAITRIDNKIAFHTADAKLLLAAGVAGFIGAAMCTSFLIGKRPIGIGAIVAVLAFATLGLYAALIRIDDSHAWGQVALLAGQLVIVGFMTIGAVKGRWGALSPLVSAAATLPTWIDLARKADEAQSRAAVGLILVIADAAIVMLAIIAFILAILGSDDAAYGAIPQDAKVSPAITPMVSPTALPPVTERKMGPVLHAVRAPVVVAAASEQPAEWLTDPYSRYELRYWNGSRWTDHVSNRGVAALDPVLQ